MKYWLLVFILTPQGEFVEKREVVYKSAIACYKAMDRLRKPKGTKMHTMCISDDHYNILRNPVTYD